MPYIKACDRDPFDDVLKQLPVTETEGELNYVLTKVVHRHIEAHGSNYAAINAAVGALECCKQEAYRRIAAPYEDRKILENGDVL
jgi:hypothetical protein